MPILQPWTPANDTTDAASLTVGLDHLAVYGHARWFDLERSGVEVERGDACARQLTGPHLSLSAHLVYLSFCV